MLEVVKRSLLLLDSRSKRIYFLLLAAQVLLSFLDLFGVLLIGSVATLAASSGESNVPEPLGGWLSSLGLPASPTGPVLLMMAGVAGLALLLKSIVSFALLLRTYRFLAHRQAMISGRLVSSILSSQLVNLQKFSSQEVAYALTLGVNSLTLGVLGGTSVIVAEAAVLIVLSVGLLAVDPLVAVSATLFFGGIALFLYRILGSRARKLGARQTETEVASIASIQNALRGYREISVSGRRTLIVEAFQGLRWRAAEVQADLQIVSQVSKYVFEVALILGAAILVTTQSISHDTKSAIAVIAIFLAATSRIVPSLLRLQQSSVGIKAAMGAAAPVFNVLDNLVRPSSYLGVADSDLSRVLDGINLRFVEFDSGFELHNVSFRYPGAESWAVSNLSLSVYPGQSLALVGPTGAGKSTIADLILGVLAPDSGTVQVGGLSPLVVSQLQPGAMAYAPQETAIFEGTVRSNVAFGIPLDRIRDDWVWSALEKAHLADFVRSQHLGLDTQVGEHGVRLSGGQRQRLGLARALFTSPQLLVMDEATSALDAETEHSVSQTIQELSGTVTLVIVAHRLATVRACDVVAYVDRGAVSVIGTFEEVRRTQPHFDKQARLLGL